MRHVLKKITANPQNFFADPRHFQIVTLSVLLFLQMFWADFGPDWRTLAITVSSALITQFIFCHRVGIPFDWRSPLITAFSLSILLKSPVLGVYMLAAFVAVASKFVIRMDNKHIFNPANIAIVLVLILCGDYAWVSPGQWGASVWLAFLLICLAFLVLYKVPRRDMAILFLAVWGGLIFGRALWLGDPMDIPFHQMQNGALLIFSFFMISDPKTIPDHILGRFIFALAVSVIAFILQFEFQVREALFYALAVACLIRPFLDRFWQASSYEWNT